MHLNKIVQRMKDHSDNSVHTKMKMMSLVTLNFPGCADGGSLHFLSLPAPENEKEAATALKMIASNFAFLLPLFPRYYL